MGKTVFQGLKERSVLMAILLAVACFLTYYLHAVLEAGHVFTHFYYIPVILASLWWQRRGLLVAVFLAAFLVISDRFFRPEVAVVINDCLRATMFIIVAFVVATLSERIEKAEDRIGHLNLVLRAIRNVNQLITREKDREKLIKGVCDNLVENRGYNNAWIALLDESGKLVAHAEARLGKDFLPMVERLKRGEIPHCGQRALKQPEAVVIEDPVSTCTDCPLSSNYAGRSAAIVRLEYMGKVYGLLSVSVPGEMATDVEEVGLFHEVATDIAFALHNMELEEERQQAEEALLESEERFRIASQIASDVVYERDLQTGIATFYGDIDSHLGYEPSGYPRTMEGFREHVHPEDLVFFDTHSLDQLESGVPFSIEYRMRKKDGIHMTWVDKVMMIMDEETGKPLKMIGVATDITERKQAEEALQESEEKYRTLVENATDYIYMIDKDMVILSTNKVATSLFGKEPDEIVGATIQDVFPKEISTGYETNLNQIFKTGIPRSSESMLVAGDKEVWLQNSLNPVKNQTGEVVVVIGVSRDITERKQAEEALADEATRRRILIEGSRDGIVVLDQEDGKVYEANQRFAEMLGYSPEEVSQLHVWDWEVQFTREHLLDMLRSVDETGDSFETQHRRKDGTTYDVEISTNGAVFAGQKLIFCVCRDLTERKQLEEERLKFDKLESVGTLAGGIAHDFNNILTGIMGNIGLAMRHVEPKSKAEERLLEAEKASLRARDLTQQMLTFSSGGAPIKKTISIGKLIEDTVGFASRGSSIRCDFDLPDNLWPVECDEGQINQVIANLAINADQAMPGGGILNIGARNTVIKRKEALPLPKGDYVEITIEDHGIGISKEHLGRIFDPYFTTKQKGSGLGLATAYSILKKHDGHITIKSQQNVGTTFHIYLPASKKAIAVEKEAKVEDVTTGGGRILVMDDEEIIREMLSKMLSLAGFEVTLTEDGAEAIEQYTKAKESGKPFGAVIMDLTIPGGMGGKEAIKKLLEIDPDAKVIVSSGYATDPTMSDFKKYGFSAVVTKPYSVSQMGKTLQGLLRKRK